MVSVLLLSSLALRSTPLRSSPPRALCAPPPLPPPLILAEHPQWLVADKPAGVTVHEGTDSVVNSLHDSGVKGKLFPVHRLDRETSGVLLLARNPTAAASLQKALQSGNVLKRYQGVLTAIPRKRKGRWDARVSSRAEGRRNPRGVAAERVPALTEYRVVDDNGFISSCEFTIMVGGRTHQIRKHAAAAGTTVFGDSRYGDKKRNTMLAKRYGISGMALHAALLQIEIDGVEYKFRASEPSWWMNFGLKLSDDASEKQ